MRDPVDGYNRSYRILVADDDPVIRDVVEMTLKAHGYDLICVPDGLAAWTAVLSQPVDLAIVDLNMPELDGYDFIARCRVNGELARLPIIVLSAAAEEESCGRAFGLGATGYITKPINWPLLAHTVWYVLRNEARETEFRALRARLSQGQPAAA